MKRTKKEKVASFCNGAIAGGVIGIFVGLYRVYMISTSSNSTGSTIDMTFLSTIVAAALVGGIICLITNIL